LKDTLGEAAYQQVREEGIEKGLEKAREEGIEIDELASRFEEKLKVLQKLLEKGAETEFAAFVTSLSSGFAQAF
jgi:predicted transposase YdaD